MIVVVKSVFINVVLPRPDSPHTIKVKFVPLPEIILCFWFGRFAIPMSFEETAKRDILSFGLVYARRKKKKRENKKEKKGKERKTSFLLTLHKQAAAVAAAQQ